MLAVLDRTRETTVRPRLISTIAVLSLLALAFALSACNTTKGFGKDIEKAGAGMKNSAERNGAE